MGFKRLRFCSNAERYSSGFTPKTISCFINLLTPVFLIVTNESLIALPTSLWILRVVSDMMELNCFPIICSIRETILPRRFSAFVLRERPISPCDIVRLHWNLCIPCQLHHLRCCQFPLHLKLRLHLYQNTAQQKYWSCQLNSDVCHLKNHIHITLQHITTTNFYLFYIKSSKNHLS